jgi:hypothetical protein
VWRRTADAEQRSGPLSRARRRATQAVRASPSRRTVKERNTPGRHARQPEDVPFPKKNSFTTEDTEFTENCLLRDLCDLGGKNEI